MIDVGEDVDDGVTDAQELDGVGHKRNSFARKSNHTMVARILTDMAKRRASRYLSIGRG